MSRFNNVRSRSTRSHHTPTNITSNRHVPVHSRGRFAPSLSRHSITFQKLENMIIQKVMLKTTCQFGYTNISFWRCVIPIPVALCSWYLSMSMCRLVLKNSSVAFNLWCIDTISFFCLDNVPLCLRRLMLEQREWTSHLQPLSSALALSDRFLSYMATFWPCCNLCQSSFSARMVCHAWPHVRLWEL